MVGSTSTEVQDLATISAWYQERTDHVVLKEHLTTAQNTEWEGLKRQLKLSQKHCRLKPSMETHARLATLIRTLQKLRTLAYELNRARGKRFRLQQ